MSEQHTPGEWEARPHESPQWMVAVKGGPFDIICVTSQGNDEANARMLAMAKAAPHECDDSKCLGNVNRLKLTVFDETVAVLRMARVVIAELRAACVQSEAAIMHHLPCVHSETLCIALKSLASALAKAEKLG